MRGINYAGQAVKLVRDDNGEEVAVGDRLPDFRGKTHTVKGAQPPHKPGSTGYVDTEYGSFYVTVLNLRWGAL